jgi:O-antigen/teichoic acid export membrane protein
MQDGKERLKQMFFRVLRVITLVSIPFGFLIATLATPIAHVLFGEQWRGVEFVVMVMALMQGYTCVVVANGELYRAIGKPSYETIVNSVLLVVYLLGYYLSIQRSFEIFVWTRFGLGLFSVPMHLLFGWIAIRLSLLSILKVILLATAIGTIAPAVNWLTLRWIHDMLTQGFATGFISVILMGIVLFVFERNRSIKEVLNLVQKKPAAV